MRSKSLPATSLLLLAFAFGALLGRRWRGDLADATLGVIALVALAAVGIAVFRYWVRKTPSLAAGIALWRAARRGIFEHPWRSVAFVGACFSLGWALALLPGMADNANYSGITVLWLVSFCAYLMAVAPPRFSWAAHSRWGLKLHVSQSQLQIGIALAGTTLVAALLRLTEIGSIPYVLAGDEATFGIQALRVIRGEISNPFAVGSLGQPTQSFFFGGLAVRWLGMTQEAIRVPWALVGIVTVPATYWLVARLKGNRLGLLTAGLLAVYHFHIHFSRLSLNNISDPLFAGLAILLLFRAMDRQSAFDWALAGAVCGLSLYSYQGARFTPVLFVAVIAYLTIYDRPVWHKHGWGVAIALGAFLIIAAPMLQYAIRLPDEFNARVNQMGILQGGWLANEMQRGRDLASILFDQFNRAALAFNFYPDRTVWYGLPGPLLDPMFGALFLLGLGYGTVRAFMPSGDRRIFPMVAWWWGATILGGMLTENPPSSMRLVTLTVPVCFFIALALEQIAVLGQRAFEWVPARAFLIAGGLVFSFLSIKTYFVDYTPSNIGGGPAAELATMVGTKLQASPSGGQVYLFGAPLVYWDFPTFAFFLPDVKATDVVAPITSPPPHDWIHAGQGGVFIFSPQRIGELSMVRETFPNGKILEGRTAASDKPLVTVYQVAPQ